MIKNKIVLSASRCKQFLDCSWHFYHSYLLKVPESTHPKTKLGTLSHIILECLCNKRHKSNYDRIINSGSVYGDKAMARLIRNFLRANPDITPEIHKHLNKLVFTALNFDFFFLKKKEPFEEKEPEYKFELDLGEIQIKGFFDRIAIFDNIIIIKDYKTQKEKFTKEQLEDNIQALFYQLAAKKIFNKPAQIDFVMLRHDCIQSVKASSDDALNGFTFRLLAINNEINKLNEETAKNNLKATKDIGFCNYVCKLKKPLNYNVLLDKDGKILSSDFNDKKLIMQKKDDQRIESRYYAGCHFFYHNGKLRNYS